MKKRKTVFFKTVIISLWCCAIFIGAGYYYIDKSFTSVDSNIESIPYAQETPENAGVLFEISGEKTFIFIDFEKENLMVCLNVPEIIDDKIYGYQLDYQISGSTEVIGEMVDYLGGIELLDIRYTGVQISEILKSNNSIELKRNIITQICQNVSKYGVAVDFFTDIITSSKTDLTVPKCYFWDDYAKSICKTIKFID